MVKTVIRYYFSPIKFGAKYTLMNQEKKLTHHADQNQPSLPTILPKGYFDYRTKNPTNLSPLEFLAEFVLNEVNYTIWFETNLDKAKEISKYFAEDGGIFTKSVMKMKNLRDYCELWHVWFEAQTQEFVDGEGCITLDKKNTYPLLNTMTKMKD